VAAATPPAMGQVTPAAGAATYQPLDSDLTAIAALSTTSFGRALLALADAAAFDNAGSDFFNGVVGCACDGAFAIDRATKGIGYAAEESFTDRNLQKATSGFDFVAFTDLGEIAEDDCAHFGFFQVEGKAYDSTWEFQHLVQFGITETFDAGDTVTDFTDDADIGLFGRVAFDGADFRFEFEDDVAHES
jgi:hypothetical protein